MEVLTYLIIALLGLITETIAAMVGFGDKLALIAILTLFIDIKKAVAIAAIYSLFAYSIRIFFYRKSFDKELFLKMLRFLIPGIIIGLVVFYSLKPQNLKLILAIFLLGFVIYKLFVKKTKIHIKELGLGIGIFIFGLVEATVGAAGPILAIFLLNYGKKKEGFVCFAASILLVSSIIRLSVYTYNNELSVSHLPLIGLLVAVSITGNYIGKRLLKKMSGKIFEYLILLLLFLIAMKEIISMAIDFYV